MADAQAAVPIAADSSAPTQAAGDALFLKRVWLTPAFAHRNFDPVPGLSAGHCRRAGGAHAVEV